MYVCVYVYVCVNPYMWFVNDSLDIEPPEDDKILSVWKPGIAECYLLPPCVAAPIFIRSTVPCTTRNENDDISSAKKGEQGSLDMNFTFQLLFFLMYKEFVSRSALITCGPGSLKLLEVIGPVRLSRGHFIYVSVRKPTSMLGEDFPVWLFGSPPFSCK